MMQTPTRPTVAIAFAAAVLTVTLTAVLTASQSPSAPQTAPAAAQSSTAPQSPDAQLATITQYCVGCHNDRAKIGGVSFEGVTADSIGQRAEVFEKAVRKLRGRVMPPPGARQPQSAATDSLIAWLETSLDHAAGQKHVRDEVVLHRLNRKEYANAVRDLLAVDFDATEVLPADDAAEGFDNIATALQVSPSFIEQYVIAARAVAVKADGRSARDQARNSRMCPVFRLARAEASSRKSIFRLTVSTRSTSPIWRRTSGATGWSSRTRWSSRSTTSLCTRR